MADHIAARDLVLSCVVVAVVATMSASMAAGAPCTWDSGVGATFDLSSLTSDSQYSVKDLYSGQDSHDFSYVFNVCENTTSIPGAGPGKDGDSCQTTRGIGGETLTGPGPAFQVANWDNYCYRLGSSASNVEWGLIEENDPAHGVYLAYIDGESCRDESYHFFRRSLKLKFVCDDFVGNIPDEEPIEEVFKCTYEMTIRTAAGCPVECPVVNGHLCNAHGVCGYDTDSQRAGCFCTTGWGGDDCATAISTSSGVSGEVVVLVVVVILLALVVAAVGFMYNKLRRLRVDPDSYKGMAGRFNELGTLAG